MSEEKPAENQREKNKHHERYKVRISIRIIKLFLLKTTINKTILFNRSTTGTKIIWKITLQLQRIENAEILYVV